MTTIQSGKVLSIVIPVFNKWNYTRSCLNDLGKLSTNHDIIIIDNASSDDTQAELTKLASVNPLIRYVRNEDNTFHSKACNQGFRMAWSDNVLFLNNDIKVKSNHNTWTQSIIQGCQTDSIIGPGMGQLDSGLNFVKEGNEQLPGNLTYLVGWCVAASKKTWNKLDIDGTGQIWNEKFPFYFNDVDLSFRARKNKINLQHMAIPDIGHFGKISAAQINIPKLYTEGRKVFLKHWSK